MFARQSQPNRPHVVESNLLFAHRLILDSRPTNVVAVEYSVDFPTSAAHYSLDPNY